MLTLLFGPLRVHIFYGVDFLPVLTLSLECHVVWLLDHGATTFLNKCNIHIMSGQAFYWLLLYGLILMMNIQGWKKKLVHGLNWRVAICLLLFHRKD